MRKVIVTPSTRYSQTTEDLYGAHSRQCLVVLVYCACTVLLWFFLQAVQLAVHLDALAVKVGLFKD